MNAQILTHDKSTLVKPVEPATPERLGPAPKPAQPLKASLCRCGLLLFQSPHGEPRVCCESCATSPPHASDAATYLARLQRERVVEEPSAVPLGVRVVAIVIVALISALWMIQDTETELAREHERSIAAQIAPRAVSATEASGR